MQPIWHGRHNFSPVNTLYKTVSHNPNQITRIHNPCVEHDTHGSPALRQIHPDSLFLRRRPTPFICTTGGARSPVHIGRVPPSTQCGRHRRCASVRPSTLHRWAWTQSTGEWQTFGYVVMCNQTELYSSSMSNIKTNTAKVTRWKQKCNCNRRCTITR